MRSISLITARISSREHLHTHTCFYTINPLSTYINITSSLLQESEMSSCGFVGTRAVQQQNRCLVESWDGISIDSIVYYHQSRKKEESQDEWVFASGKEAGSGYPSDRTRNILKKNRRGSGLWRLRFFLYLRNYFFYLRRCKPWSISRSWG